MKKRGNTYILYVVIEIVFAIFIVYSLRGVINSVVSNEAFDKMQFAKDLSLQSNALYTVPGNMYIINENEREFSFTFSDKSFRVYKGDTDKTEGIYNYVGLKDKEFENKLYKPENIILVKDGDSVEAKSNIELPNKIICPRIKTQDFDWKNKYKIFVDPAHGSSEKKKDPGIENDNLKLKKESLVTLAIAEGIKALNSDIELTRDFETYMSMEERKEKLKDANIVISVHIGKYSDETNHAKAYVSLDNIKKRESEKLACLILNSFAEEFNIEISTPTPVNTKSIDSNDPKSILELDDKITVLLEIGNVDSEQGIKMLNDLTPIPNIIYESITKYFE